MKSVLVTGANGFVGSAIVGALRHHGVSAVPLVRGGAQAVAGARRLDGVWTPDSLSRVLDGVEVVVHCASIVHRPGTSEDEYRRFNVDATRALAEACHRCGVRRLIHVSTIKVYGETPAGVMDEAMTPAPEGHYALTKLEAERVLAEVAARGGPAPVVLRLCPVFGVGDKGHVRTMIRAMARRRFVLPGDGSTRKSLVHVSTVADVVRATVDSDLTGVFVVADREAPTMAQLADTIGNALGVRRALRVPTALVMAAAAAVELSSRVVRRQPTVTRELVRKSLKPTVCSPAAIERALGIHCHVDLAEAVQREIEWLRSARVI